MSSAPPPPPPPAASGWAGLPHDVLWSAFTVLGQREILSGAGLACAAWWRFARDEPALWRRIDLRASSPRDEDPVSVCEQKTPAKVCDDDSSGWKAMALAAIDRSAGQGEAFWGRADDEVLLYLADRFGLDILFSSMYIHIWGSQLTLLLLPIGNLHCHVFEDLFSINTMSLRKIFLHIREQ